MKPLLNILLMIITAQMSFAQASYCKPSADAPIEIHLLTDYFALDSLNVYCLAQGRDLEHNIDFYVLNSNDPFVTGDSLRINDSVVLAPDEYGVYDPYNILIFDRPVLRRIADSYNGQYSDNPKCGPDEFIEQIYIQFELTMIRMNLFRAAAQSQYLNNDQSDESDGLQAYLTKVDLDVNIDNLQMLISDVDRRMEQLRSVLSD